MKKLVYFFSLAALLATTACKDDDGGGGDPTPVNENKITYDGDTFTTKSGAIEDYGNEESEGFYNYDFYITDAQYVQNGSTFDLEGDPEILFYAALYSPSSSSFKTGTYTFFEQGDDVSEDDYIFPFGIALVDVNGNGEFEDNDDEFMLVTDGEVTVSGSNRNYTVTFDVTLDNGKEFKGKYAGDFVYEDYRGQNERQAFTAASRQIQLRKQALKLK